MVRLTGMISSEMQEIWVVVMRKTAPRTQKILNVYIICHRPFSLNVIRKRTMITGK